MHHLLSAADLDRDEVAEIMDLAEEMALVQSRPVKKLPGAARPYGGQPVLRGLDPDPVLLRAGRQVAVGGRDQHQRQGLVGLQGRVAAGHRADRRRDGRGRPGHPAPRLRGALADHPLVCRGRHRRPRPERRRRHPRAPDPGPAGRLHHATALRPRARPGRLRRPEGGHRRRHHPLPGGPQQRAAAGHPGRRGGRGRPADPAAGRDRVLAGAR